MNCPFCAEEVKADAIVCKHCRRDISIPKPILERNRALEGTVAELHEEIARLQHLLAARPALPEVTTQRPGIPEFVFGYVLAPILLLVAAHYLFIIKLDVNPIYLRIVSMLIPLPFGYVAIRRARPTWPLIALLAVGAGFASVLAMSAVVGIIDGIPILPSSAFEWRETIEYMMSIGLAFVLGALIASRTRGRSSAESNGRAVDRFVTQIAMKAGAAKSGEPLEHRIAWVEKMLNMGLSISAGVGSIYTGLKAFIQ